MPTGRTRVENAEDLPSFTQKAQADIETIIVSSVHPGSRQPPNPYNRVSRLQRFPSSFNQCELTSHMQTQPQKSKRKRDRGARSLAQTRSLTSRLRKRARSLRGRYILTRSMPRTRIGDRAKRSTQSPSILKVRTSGTFFLARSTAQVSWMLEGHQSISGGWAMDGGRAMDPVGGRCTKQSRKWEYESLAVTQRRVGGTTRPSSSHKGKATIRNSAATTAIVLSMGRSTVLIVIHI